jgi:proline iminopeptidase
MFGMHGGLDSVHDLLLRACNDLELFGFLTHPTLTAIDSYGGFENNILYAILHEAIYCQG